MGTNVAAAESSGWGNSPSRCQGPADKQEGSTEGWGPCLCHWAGVLPWHGSSAALMSTEMPTSLLEEVGVDAASLSIPVFCQLGTVPLAGFWPPEFGQSSMPCSPSSTGLRAGWWCWGEGGDGVCPSVPAVLRAVPTTGMSTPAPRLTVAGCG